MNTAHKAYGYDNETGAWIFGDCTVDKEGNFHFPSQENLRNDGLQAPLLFPGSPDPQAHHAAMDWEQERIECARIFTDLMNNLTERHGQAGMAILAAPFVHLAHPWTLTHFGAKPSMILHGGKATGKTLAGYLISGFFGFGWGTFGLSIGTTDAELQHILSAYSCIPAHFDNWRKIHESEAVNELVRNCYNEMPLPNKSIPRGVRSVVPLCCPIITGEQIPRDPALTSRFLIVKLRPSTIPNTSDSYRVMKAMAGEAHRITRYILHDLPWFSRLFRTLARNLYSDHDGERNRGVIASSAFKAAMIALISCLEEKTPDSLPDTEWKQRLDDFASWLDSISG